MAIYLTLLLIIAVCIGLYFLIRHRRTPARARDAAHKTDTDKTLAGSLEKLQENSFFWGAELWQPGCTESYKMLGQKFAFGSAPEMPFEGCTRKICTCQFKGLRDRRIEARRLQPDRRDQIRFDKTHPDRRSRISRRRSDLWANHAL